MYANVCVWAGVSVYVCVDVCRAATRVRCPPECLLYPRGHRATEGRFGQVHYTPKGERCWGRMGTGAAEAWRGELQMQIMRPCSARVFGDCEYRRMKKRMGTGCTTNLDIEDGHHAFLFRIAFANKTEQPAEGENGTLAPPVCDLAPVYAIKIRLENLRRGLCGQDPCWR